MCDHTGLRVHPHIFRHIAPSCFLEANPGADEVVPRVLGHRSIDTTTGFYTGLETPAAVRHFDKTILHLRRESSAGDYKRTKTNPPKRSEKGK